MKRNEEYKAPMVIDFEISVESGYGISSTITEMENLENIREKGEW